MREPKYLQLKQEIKSWFTSARCKQDGKIPSEMELVNHFKVSRHTVRQALGILEKEGLLYKVQGKGTFVSISTPKKPIETKTIGLLTTNISNYISPGIIKGVEKTLRNKGYNLVLCSTNNDKRREEEQIKKLISQPLSGLIIEPTKSAEENRNLGLFLSLTNQNIPYVMINERYTELSSPCIKMDDEEGGFIAGQHLIQLGHRRIVGFFKTDDLQGVHRLKGFIRSHRNNNISLNPDLVISYKNEDKDSKLLEAVISLLIRKAEKPTAIVCYNDEFAIKLLEVVRQAGLNVPEDISIVSFDDSSLAKVGEVKLTSIKHSKMEMGVTAAELLLNMIEENGHWDNDILMKPELIARNSTKKYCEAILA